MPDRILPDSGPSLADVPPLTIGPVSPADQRAALRLVADSIAQQRQIAAQAILRHPITIGALMVVLRTSYKFTAAKDVASTGLPAIAISFLLPASAVIMTLLLLARWLASPYITHAESFAAAIPSYVTPQDVVLGAKFGDEYVAVLVLRLQSQDTEDGEQEKKRGVGVIRAWTTRLRYRRRGLGGDMLHEAVKVTRAEFGPEAAVIFDPAHANSLRVLPELFCGKFSQQEELARRLLGKALLAGAD